jgi:preprotein translocase subunit SecE
MIDAGGVEQPRRYVAIFYVLAAVAFGFFLEKVIALAFSYARVNDFQVLGEGWSLSTVIGFAVAVVVAVVVWRIPRTQSASLEVALELRRVTWPTMRETRAATIAVIVASFVAAIILGGFDAAWAWLSSLIYRTN